jgi:GT2 family glycosyltransferase/glycosyltransferase involved in cell wall biosynthesis/SAM-dependent methyltransferase
MHDTAMEIGKAFFDTYLKTDTSLTIVDVGAQDVNGSLRSVAPPHHSYIGLDFVDGKGVDVVITDPYNLPLESNSVDVVVCSSCFEHSEFFWLLFIEIQRILKPDGLFYLNVPSNGVFHRYPVDCWRFYPDSGIALQNWGRKNGYNTALLESFTGKQKQDIWNDFVAVFVKDSAFVEKYTNPMQTEYRNFTNGLVYSRDGDFHHHQEQPEDFKIIRDLESKVHGLDAENTSRLQTIQDLEGKVHALDAESASRLQTIQDLEGKVHALDSESVSRLQTIQDLEGKLTEETEAHQLLAHQYQALTDYVNHKNLDLRTAESVFKKMYKHRLRKYALRLLLGKKMNRRIRRWLRNANLGDPSIGEKFLTISVQSLEHESAITQLENDFDNEKQEAAEMKNELKDQLINVSDWGPHQTICGEAVNAQPDGSSALWVRVVKLKDVRIFRVQFGDAVYTEAHMSGDDVITSEIPEEVIANPGTYPVHLIASRQVKIFVGHFQVDAPQFPTVPYSGYSLKKHFSSLVKGLWLRRVIQPVATPIKDNRILVADFNLPRADNSAGDRATKGLLADLVAAGFEVVFIPRNMKDKARYRSELEKLGITVITRKNGFMGAVDYIKTHGHTFSAFYLIRVGVAERLLSTARAVNPQARIVFHAPDLHFLRETRAAQLSGRMEDIERAKDTQERETIIMRASDHVVIVSPAELPYLENIVPRDKISVFPALYSSITAQPKAFKTRKNIFFLGGFKHTPNVEAVHWFVDNVWPTVHAAMPQCAFHILGSKAPDDIKSLGKRPGVRFIGYVSDLEPVLGGYRLSVAPLLHGAGIKGKLGTSLGSGTPAVTTAIGAEGMGIVDGVHAFVRDDAKSFADAVISLYQDEQTWSRMAVNGQKLVEQNFGEMANRASFLRTLESAGVLTPKIYLPYCQSTSPMAMPQTEDAQRPDVSIIIPVHNQWHLTQACLKSVALAVLGSGITAEVILADDMSSDETRTAAQLYPGLRIVRQDINLGFLKNCNAAAQQARGEFLLFLNNDTVVMPNWLVALMDTMAKYPKAAIAGSRMLYPDGRVQEAGSVLFSDGSAHNVGRGLQRDDLFLKKDREVDYVSGCSMLVRRSFWESVGGFDEIFAPAYCEDSDLAMAARHQGWMVVYSGASVIVHFEHGTYGEQDHAPSMRMKVNNEKLYTKWHANFAKDHLPPGTKTLVAAAHAERTPPV